MPSSYRPYQPEQSLLLPPSPRDWLPPNHLALYISDVVDELDLSGFVARYEEGDPRGNQAFHPAMMLKLLVYAYATGTFSSRKIAQKVEEDVAYRVLAAGNFPQHRTICDFRLGHLQAFIGVFTQVVRIAKESGLVKLGRVAIDGTKVKANASRYKGMSYGRMKKEEERLEKEIKELLKEAERADRREDKQFGEDKRGDELPEELKRREERLAVIRAAKKRVEERQAAEDKQNRSSEEDGDKSKRKGPPRKEPTGVPDDSKQENFTDPDSRIMKSSIGFEQAYNAQISVDEQAQIIVAADVTTSGSDRRQLLPMIEQTVGNVGQPAACVIADAGYRSESNFRTAEAREMNVLVALGRERDQGQEPKIAAAKEATRRMKEKLAKPEGREAYRRRKAIVEPVFGWVKRALGFRQFGLRGLEKVQGEWQLVCLALNLRRMATM
jgi:transposase